MGRPDGRRIKTITMEYAVAAHVMAKRSDAMNMITLDIPIEPIRKYLNQKRNEEGKRYSHLTVMIAALAQTLAEFPALNRFVVNKRIYARNHIAIGMVVLKGGKIDEIGTTDKMIIPKDATIDEVNEIVNSYVEKNRDQNDVNGTDKVAGILTGVPGLLRFGAGLLKWMDKHNIMPKAVVEMSPFHCSVMLTNLASIKTNHIYHHTYDFGTVSLALAMGNLREVPVKKKGEIVFERCMPIGLVMDERVASGSYFAMAFRKTQALLKNPALMEQRPKVVEDIL